MYIEEGGFTNARIALPIKAAVKRVQVHKLDFLPSSDNAGVALEK